MDVFISYSSKDYEIAYYINNFLKANGIETWMAPESMSGTMSYTKEIPAAIKGCDIFLLLLSKSSQESVWVPNEMETAFKHKKDIIPYLIENCEVTEEFDFILSRVHRIDGYHGVYDALRKLVLRIRKTIRKDENNTSVKNLDGYPAKNDVYDDCSNNENDDSDSFEIKVYDHTKKEETEKTEISDVDAVKELLRRKNDTVTINYKSGSTYMGPTTDGTPDGKPDGFGLFTWHTGEVYYGNFKNGERDGKGVFTWCSGTVYEGDFLNGKRTGYGILRWDTGDVYEGYFVDDKRCGKGKLIWTSGDVYEGEFKNDTINGKGTLTWEDGNSYTGDFIDGKRQGKGVFTWKGGDHYEGGFSNDYLHGKGKLVYISEGKTYEGDFKYGKLQGHGKMVWNDGKVYEGDFTDDEMSGKGKMTWNDGSNYEGDFLKGEIYGTGKMTWEDGNVCEGPFVNGKLNGKGKFIWTNGDVTKVILQKANEREKVR